MAHDHPDRHHHEDQHPHHVHFDTEEAAVSAEQEAEVLGGFLLDAVGRAREVAEADGLEVRRVLDVGCGPGVGTVHLARAFPGATVLAADASGAMLERAAARIEREGLGHRVTTRPVDLPTDFAALGGADLVWASMVLHHLGDEADALRSMGALLPPGGLLVLVERSGLVRIGDDPAWDRLEAAWDRWFAGVRAALPGSRPSAPYPAMLAAAGFEVVVAEPIQVTLEPPIPEAGRAFAHRQLDRALVELADQLGPADDAVLRHLLEPAALAAAPIRATRDLFVARRPA
jgi:SAM-dependent methyltransferase